MPTKRKRSPVAVVTRKYDPLRFCEFSDEYFSQLGLGVVLMLLPQMGSANMEWSVGLSQRILETRSAVKTVRNAHPPPPPYQLIAETPPNEKLPEAAGFLDPEEPRTTVNHLRSQRAETCGWTRPDLQAPLDTCDDPAASILQVLGGARGYYEGVMVLLQSVVDARPASGRELVVKPLMGGGWVYKDENDREVKWIFGPEESDYGHFSEDSISDISFMFLHRLLAECFLFEEVRTCQTAVNTAARKKRIASFITHDLLWFPACMQEFILSISGLSRHWSADIGGKAVTHDLSGCRCLIKCRESASCTSFWGITYNRYEDYIKSLSGAQLGGQQSDHIRSTVCRCIKAQPGPEARAQARRYADHVRRGIQRKYAATTSMSQRPARSTSVAGCV